MKIIRVSAAVIHDGKKVFITRKADGGFKGLWEFPGGKIENGESGEEAAVREIKEELELDIEVEKKLFTVEYDYPLFHLEMECYLARIKSGTLMKKEHDKCMWICSDEIISIPFCPADIIVAEKLKSYFSSN